MKTRVLEVDALRTVALFGICVVHMPGFALTWSQASSIGTGLDALFKFAVPWLFSGKFFLLFSFAFGWSFWAALSTKNASDDIAYQRMKKRCLGLIALGLAHVVFVFTNDTLVVYGLLGLGLLRHRAAPLSVLKRRALFWSACAIPIHLIVGYIYASIADSPPETKSAGELLTFFEVMKSRLEEAPFGILSLALLNGPMDYAAFCLGAVAGRVGFFDRASEHYAALRSRRMLLLAVGLTLNAAFAVAMLNVIENHYLAALAFTASAIGGPPLAAAYLTFVVDASRRFGNPSLIVSGRMSLTSYVLQGVCGGLLFYQYGFGFYGKTDAFGSFIAACGIFVFIHGVCWIWFTRFQDGPLEMALRRISRVGETS
jgi:uncharacterized protein